MTLDIFGNLDVEATARDRYSSGLPDALLRRQTYEKYHRWYAPPGGDQWEEDILERPGKIHINANIIRRFIDTEARLLSIKPRITIRGQSDEQRSRMAEATEKLFDKWLQQSGMSSWYFTFEQTKALYGLGILKVFWNDKTKQPDVIVVEQPQNIMLGWGDSQFISLDWAIYHYKISKLQARMRYKECPEEFLNLEPEPPSNLSNRGGKHTDPLDQTNMFSTGGRIETDYERDQVTVWDYWYLDEDGKVYNAILINGHIVEGPTLHTELPAIPYIVAEHDHEPGSPDGRGMAELLIDIQDGLNRAISHYAQYIWDNSDPAYQLAGPEAPMTIPDGLVPRPGEIVAPGPNARIELINMGVNNFPFDALIASYWNVAHRVTGLSEVLFGIPSSAQSSGRAIAIQLESSINALDPKRQRSYIAIETLLMMWHHMAMKKKPIVAPERKEVDEETGEEVTVPALRASDIIKGMTEWHIVAPEITPRDVREHTMNTIDKINAKLLSTETGMHDIGVENPLEELDRIRKERSDAHLYPGDAQGILAVAATAQQIGMQQQQQGAMAAAAEGMGAQDAALADRQEAQPSLSEDMNQVATGAGMPPGQGGEEMGGQFRPILRQGPDMQSQAMSEIRLPTREF